MTEATDPATESDSAVDVPRTGDERYTRRPRRERRKKRQTPLRDEPWFDNLVRYGVLALVLAAPVLAGGVHFFPAVALGSGGVALGGLAIWGYRERGLRVGAIGIALTLWTLATALQLVPLPLGIVSILAPESAEYHEAAAALTGGSASMVPISVSPARTALAMWHVLGFVGLFTAAVLHFRQRENFGWLVPRLPLVGVGFLLVAVIQTTIFPTAILGVWPLPTHRELTPLTTTLMNPNHAAGLFAALAPIALGVGIASRDVAQRYTHLMVYVVLSVAMFLMLSRGAVVAWVASHLVFLLVSRTQVLKNRRRGVIVGTLAIAIVALVAIFGQSRVPGTFDRLRAGAESVVAEENSNEESSIFELDDDAAAARALDRAARRESIEKVTLHREMLPLIGTYGPLGVGRDAFGDIYPRHATHGVQLTYRHAENEYLQFAIEYGPILALAVFGLLFVGLLSPLSRVDWRDQERPLIAGMLTAIVVIAVHNFFDFNARIPGVGFTLAVCLGALAGRTWRYDDVARSKRRESTSLERFTGRGRQVAGWAAIGALLVGTLVAIATLPTAMRGASRADIDAVRATVESYSETPPEDPEAARESLLALAKPVIEARPADGYAHLIVAIGMLRTGDGGLEAALPWLGAAVKRAPFDYRTQLLLARVLAATGDQAASARAFARAAELQAGPSRAVARSVAELLTGTEHLMDALSADPQDWSALGEALLAARRFEDALALAESLDTVHPDEPNGLSLLVQTHLALGFAEAAVDPAAELVARFPETPWVYRRKAEVALALGDLAAVEAVMITGLTEHPKDLGLLYGRVEDLLWRLRGQYDDALVWQETLQATMTQLRPIALSRQNERPRYHYLRGEMLRAFDNPGQAIRAYEESNRLRVSGRALIGIFECALELGDIERAEATLETLETSTTAQWRAQQRKRLLAREADVEKELMESPFLVDTRELPESVRRKLGIDGVDIDPLSPDKLGVSDPARQILDAPTPAGDAPAGPPSGDPQQSPAAEPNPSSSSPEAGAEPADAPPRAEKAAPSNAPASGEPGAKP